MTRSTAPDAVGPILGFRIWHVDSQRRFARRWGTGGQVNPHFGRLLPLGWPRNAVGWPGWTPLRAECRTDKPRLHRSPGVDCRCGVYAFNTVDRVEESLLFALAEEFRGYTRRNPHGRSHRFWLVAGTVALWGRVIEGTHGYRTEYAYPHELWVLPTAVFGDADVQDEARLATDLLPALRSRYGVSVGYAGHSPDWNRLLVQPNLGQFFGWRFHRGGRDELGRAIGDIGQPSARLPTVGDALDLHFAETRLWERRHEKLVAETYLRPALGEIPLRSLGRQHLAQYRARVPRHPGSGRPYSERTVGRHLAIVRAAARDASERGWFVPVEPQTAIA